MEFENKTRLLCLLVMALFQVSAAIDAADTRIVGGEMATISAAPYIVQLLRDSSFICGGSLIHSQFVVTAAHCIIGYVPTRFSVRGGATYLADTGVVRNVVRFMRPSAYDTETQNMDVAVLKLESGLSGDNISVISLCTSSPPTNAAVYVYGWGATGDESATSNQLQTVKVLKVSKTTCASKYSPRELTDSMMCASAPGKDSCYGDSGGPLIYNNKLCGLVSWGYECATEYPGVYTDTVYATNFIKIAMSKLT